MSGFDKNTGWCHFTPKKWNRYYRKIEGFPTYIDERFRRLNIPFYTDKTGGIHAKCTDGEMWTILSGEPSTFSAEMPTEDNLNPEYLTVTDIGINIEPNFSAIKVNKVLVENGYQTKVDGSWRATTKGQKFSIELEGGRTRDGNQTYLKWRYEIIELLNKSA